MSGLTPPGPPVGPPPELPRVEPDHSSDRVQASVNDALIVLAWSVVLALVAAFVWWRLTPLAEFSVTEKGITMGSRELGRQVDTDGWFFVVALVAGLLTGFVLLLWRRRDPLLMVVFVAVGAVLSTYLMTRVGLALGPEDPAVRVAEARIGDTLPLQLKVQATGVYAAWGVGALLGAVAAIWGTERR